MALSSLKAEKILKLVFVPLLFVWLILSFYHPIEIEDIWWHLATGRHIIETASIPHEDIFSFTEEKTPWIFTDWMGSCAYYIVYKIGNLQGLKVFRLLLFLSAMLIFFFWAKKKVPFVFLVLLIPLMAYGLQTRLLLRPLAFNFVFIQILLIQLLAYQNDLNKKRLMIIPLLGVLWGNIHMGSFVYGNAILGIFLFSAIINFLNSKFNDSLKEGKAKAQIQIKDLSMTLIVYLSVFIINPSGVDGFLFPYRVFLDPDFFNWWRLNDFTSEMLPPSYIFSYSGLWAVVLFVMGVLALMKNKQNNFTYTVLFAFSLYMFLHGNRGSAFFTIISVYIIVQSAANSNLKESFHKLSWSKIIHPVIYVVMILLLAAQSTHRINQKVYHKKGSVRYLALNYDPYNPVSSVEFLKSHNITGKIFAEEMYGGYIIWTSYPELKPFVYGRRINQELLSKHIVTIAYPDRYWPVAQNEFDFDIVLLNAANGSLHKLILHFIDRPEWQLIFVDGPHLVYVRRGRYNLPKELNNFEKELKSITYSAEDLKFLKQASADKEQKVKDSYLNPSYSYIHPLEEAASLIGFGFKGAGVQRLKSSPKISDQPMTRRAIREALKFL